MTYFPDGKHFIVELSGCPREYLSNLELIQNALTEGVRLAKATLLGQQFHKFSPEGVSGILLLAESHCSIHTWPEEGYAAIDIYTCGDHSMPEIAFNFIARSLQAKETFISYIKRGIPEKNRFTHELVKSDIHQINKAKFTSFYMKKKLRLLNSQKLNALEKVLVSFSMAPLFFVQFVENLFSFT